ncbi:Protein of unknown function [Roseivivax marinus]|uniref:DUF2484 family protein n=1 Tax=Roseivivax marinus TaxID=1379903 RepID=UPI0008C4E58B|nr:DUF2484 family protein [Roseivivax marinus]SEK91454.1 Protein of unknown function [Roseivivax marinus]
MSAALVAACFWVLGACLTACLPMRRQYVPGVTLLLILPVLLVWIGRTHGVVWTLIAIAGAASLFRRPLVHLVGRALGRPVVEDPS